MITKWTYNYLPDKVQITRVSAAMILATTAGCGQVSMQLGSADVETPMVITGSINTGVETAHSDIDLADREVIAEVLDTMANPSGVVALTETRPGARWLNRESGNSGTVSKIDTSQIDETGCLGFQTTANTIAGVKLYQGTACRDITQRMVITSLSVADA